MVTARALVALVATVMAAPTAQADRAALREARRVIEDEVRYDLAQELLVAALRRGDNRPDDLVAIYELAGVTSIVLGQREVGEQYFRRLLALRPQAKLSIDTAPKILEPFSAAQAHMAAVGNLRVSVKATTALEVVVEITADPLGMVAAAQVRYVDGTGEIGLVRRPAPAPITVRIPAGATADSVEIVDEHGNHLLELSPPELRADGGPDPVDAGGSPNRLLRWPTWAIAAGVSGGIGVGFAIDGGRSHARLDDILANPEDHFFAEAESARRRWQRDATVANVAFVAAGVFVAGAVTVAVIGRRAAATRVAVVPWSSSRGGGGGGISVIADWP